MNIRYKHLLSPIVVGNSVLKTRMISTNALPHFLQGPETYPADPIITHLANIAKNGAAIVSIMTYTDPGQRRSHVEDGKRFPMFDLTDPSVGNYFSQLADAVHFYDSKLSICITPLEAIGFIPGPPSPEELGPDGRLGVQDASKTTREKMDLMISEAGKMAKFYQSVGFDMVTLHMAFRMGPSHIGLSKFLSPISNKRQDEYGGSVENRVRLPLEICRSIKETCGEDFLVEAIISGQEEPGGITIEDNVAFAKLAEGTIDILQIRSGAEYTNHPTGFNSIEGHPVTLPVAEAIKESGAKIVTAPVGGYQNLDENEAFIASGKTDMIAMGRAFICDPEYGKKAYEGRGEDLVPCIRCAKCHVPNIAGPWVVMCSVNPIAGISARVNRMIDAPKSAKEVAVIGGGPAGIKAAIVAAEKGHKVTLYEKNNFLGGQLRHADFSSFKWPLRNFKDYLIRQTNKSGIKVLLNTEATPEMIQAEDYDAVLVATGAEPAILDIPGARGKNVWTPIEVYGLEKDLGKNVVVIGGAQIGAETALYLAQNGHNVTVLTRQNRLATDATPIHYREMFQESWEKLPNFSFVVEATTTGISEEKVTFIDNQGNEKVIEADSVVMASGMTPKRNEALKFYGSAGRFFLIGDCRDVGNVQKCMRSAFAAASLI